MTGQLWTPPDGDYAKDQALKEKQAKCAHHLHFVDHAETKMIPAFLVECCLCDLRGIMLQHEARTCSKSGPIVIGQFQRKMP